MENLIEYCKDRYEEELEYRPSLSHVICWLLIAISIYSFYTLNEETLLDSIGKIKVSDLIGTESGVISSLTLTQLAFSIIIARTALIINNKISQALFYLFSLKSDFNDLVICITKQYLKANSDESKASLASKASALLEKHKKKLRNRLIITDIAISFSIGNLIGTLNHANATNITLSIIGAIASIVITWKSFHYFIEEILPYSIATNYSKGSLKEFNDLFEEAAK